MSKVLIMLTMTYPYDVGSNFLSGEYDSINNNYDKIFVFCLAADRKNKLNHKLSKKWYVFCRQDQQNVILRRIKYMLYGIKNINKKELRKEINIANCLSAKLMAIYYYGRLENYWHFIKRNVQELIFNSSDIIVIYSFWFLQSAHCAGLLKKYLKEKFHCNMLAISRAHGYDLYEYRYKADYLPFRGRVLEGLDYVYPCSQDGTVYLKKKYPSYKNKIKCSHLGTYDQGMNPTMIEQQFIITSCSSIISVKRLQLLAEALSLLEKQGVTDIKWLCVGDGELKTTLMDYCKTNLSKINVIFLGYLTNCKVFDLYRHQHIDAFINVSSSEGLPVSVMEAQSFGIPVIATMVGGTSEIVNNNNGILLTSDPTPQEVAAAIKQFKCLSKDKMEIKRILSRNNWQKCFDAKFNYKKFHRDLTSGLTDNT